MSGRGWSEGAPSSADDRARSTRCRSKPSWWNWTPGVVAVRGWSERVLGSTPGWSGLPGWSSKTAGDL
eukprot:16170988-Heterocapsa_arctica.AAC.1